MYKYLILNFDLYAGILIAPQEMNLKTEKEFFEQSCVRQHQIVFLPNFKFLIWVRETLSNQICLKTEKFLTPPPTPSIPPRQ